MSEKVVYDNGLSSFGRMRTVSGGRGLDLRTTTSSGDVTSELHHSVRNNEKLVQRSERINVCSKQMIVPAQRKDRDGLIIGFHCWEALDALPGPD